MDEAVDAKVHRKLSQPSGPNFIPDSCYSAGLSGYKLGWSIKSGFKRTDKDGS